VRQAVQADDSVPAEYARVVAVEYAPVGARAVVFMAYDEPALRWQVHMLRREATALRAARRAVAEAQRLPRRVAGRRGRMRRGDG
jgi:hypothetical protein